MTAPHHPDPVHDDPDAIADAMLPVAAALAVAVDEHDADAVAATLAGLSVRELHGLAIVLAAHVDVEQPWEANLSPDRVCNAALHAAARTFGTTTEAILSTDRHRHVGDARAVAIAVARQAGFSSLVVGARFRRDHTTVLYAENRVATTPALAAAAARIAGHLGLRPRRVNDEAVA